MGKGASLLIAVSIFWNQAASCGTPPRQPTAEARRAPTDGPPKQKADRPGGVKREREIRAAVEKALAGPAPEGYAPIPRGVRLLAVKVEGQTVTLDFSRELLAGGAGLRLEDALHQILVKVGNAAPAGSKEAHFKILVEGTPLAEYLDN